MAKNQLVTLGLLGIGAYLLFRNNVAAVTEENPYTYGSGGPGSTTAPPPPNDVVPSETVAASLSPAGDIAIRQIGSVREGVDFINQSVATGSRIVAPVGATLAKTGKSSTISRLADGSIVALSVKSVPKGTSFFDKPVKVINGKRTRVY